MTWDILFHTLSASKMSSTRCIIQKKKKNSQFHKTVLTLKLQYFCRSIYTNFKNIHPLRRIYHNYLQLTGKSRKLENLPIMLLGHHRMYSSGCSGMKGVRSIHKYLQDLFRLVNFYDNSKWKYIGLSKKIKLLISK